MSAPALDALPLSRRRPIAWLASSTVTVVLLIGTLLLGLGLRLLWLDAKSLWYDEAASLYFAGQPLPDLIRLTITRDTPPPLYYLALHGWLGLFGDGVFAVRALSALASVLCLPVFFLLARTLAGRTTALLATALLALAPFHIWYAQEARMYALLALAGLTSTLVLVRLLQRPGWGRWLAYVAATGVMLWVHYLALFTLAAQALVVLALTWRGQPAAGDRRWLWTAVPAAGLTLLPWAPAFLIQSQTYRRFWIPLATPEMLEKALWEFSSMHAPYWRLPGDRPGLVVLGFLALAIVGGVALRRHGRLAWLLPVMLAVLPLALSYLIGTVRPLFLSRTLIVVTPFYVLLIAAGVVGLARGQVLPARPAWGRALATLGLVWILAWNVLGLYNLYRSAPKENWDQAAALVASRAQPGDVILFHSAPGQLPFQYYFRSAPVSVMMHGVPHDFETASGAMEQEVTETALARLDTVLPPGRSLWLVLSHDEYVDPEHRVVTLLDARRPLVERFALYRIEVRHYGS